MKPDPYIGVTGVAAGEDLGTIEACARLVCAPYRLFAGVLVSNRTLAGEKSINRRYPALSDAHALMYNLAFIGGEACVPAIHYHTREPRYLATQLKDLHREFPQMRALQLNMVEPDPGIVYQFADEHPHVEIIIQLNRGALEATRRTRGDADIGYLAAWYAHRYSRRSHLLFDASGGHGTPLDLRRTEGLLRADVLRGSPYRVGIAGGLGPDSRPELQHLAAAAHEYFSVCAESDLRLPVDDPIEGASGQDLMDRGRALAYVAEAMGVLIGTVDNRRAACVRRHGDVAWCGRTVKADEPSFDDIGAMLDSWSAGKLCDLCVSKIRVAVDGFKGWGP